MSCVPADDAYLIAAFPLTVQRQREKWMITVLLASEGTYTVNLAAAPFAYEAVLADTTNTIRGQLQFLLGAQNLAAVSAVGLTSIMLDEVKPLGLDVTASGPIPDSISATLISGGDTNAAFRAFWLTQALCGMPPCCNITCKADYTLMHAALAAHWIFVMGNLNGSGSSASDFQSQRLGPASLTKGKSAWSANPADGDLAQTAPGQLYLMLRAKYVLPAFCV